MSIKKKLNVGRGVAALLLAAALLLSGGCAGQSVQPGGTASPAPLQTEAAQPDAQGLRAAVLYDGLCSDGSWEDRFSHLEQSLLLDFTAQAVDVTQGYDLGKYDVLYPDVSVMYGAAAETLRTEITAFAAAGGGVFLDNAFYDFFDPGFLGAESFEKIEGFPRGLEYPELGADLGSIQQIIGDFALLYQQFPDFSTVSLYDYGYGMHAGSAQVLVSSGGLALYTMNRYGEGYVFFTNPLLPNSYAINGFSMTSRGGEQKTLSNTTASCNQLLENEFAAYLAKQKNGYALTRVFGSFTRPNMAWELHFEEITGFENGSGILFGELCRQSNQVPSYTLIRNTYKWFLKAESVSFLLGQEGESFAFEPDDYENAYSSGTHVAAGGTWLSLATVENGGSYFVDDPSYTQRAYPYAADIDGDGLTDLLCGSSDGYFYFYRGLGFTDRLETETGVRVTDSSGVPLTVLSYSAPVMADVDGDGALDIISGCGEGKIYWFSGNGDLTFEYEGLLCNAKVDGQSLPDIGDLNGDGNADLVVGSGCGRLEIWYGSGGGAGAFAGAEAVPLDGDTGSWLAPRIADLNGDGLMDLAVGTFDGYIMCLYADGDGGFEQGGFLTCGQNNYKGNANLKFGNNCVPFFADLNGDGTTDLLCGSLEYGLAYPIDSPYFQYREQLQQAVDYILGNDFYLGVHFYTHEYASAEQERQELDMHMRAMASYGIDTGDVGANHHTWYSSTLSPAQSLLSEWESGLLWDSGFMPAGNSLNAPQINAQNVISLPFFLTRDGERTILVQNCATLLYADEAWTQISARYGMPVCIYYHCDFTAGDPETARAEIARVESFRSANRYNFVTEEQLMRATAAAYNLTVTSSCGDEDGAVTLTPGMAGADLALFDEAFQSCCGVKVTPGESLAGTELSTDADVWYRDGESLYIALNRPVKLFFSDGAGSGGADESHIEAVNVPADITLFDGGARLDFLEGTMMQVTVYGSAATDDAGWDVVQEDGRTVFTKYGQAQTLTLYY